MNIQEFIATHQQRVNRCLEDYVSKLPNSAPRIKEAMEYSLFAKGKRVRPVLVYAAATAVSDWEASQANQQIVDAAACALECIHTYSLIHDDLPAMDDDDLRRGMPTCHIAFDEATAILAGDALLTMAFEILAQLNADSAATALRLVKELAVASGAAGMVGGQMLDLAATDKAINQQQLEQIHHLKTGALIRASVLMGALAAGAESAQQLSALEDYASAVGFAFQIQDDILDVTSTTQTLGKPQGADARLHKSTYVSLLGLEQAKARAEALLDQANVALQSFDQRADALRLLAGYIVHRDR